MRFLLPPDRGTVRAAARASVLADWMTAWLETEVKVEIAPSYRELALALERGEVDLAWAPPAICARRPALSQTLLTVVRYGATSCRAALVVRKADGRRSVRDLSGARAAWVDPLSTSGHLMALLYVREQGLDPEKLFGAQTFAGSYRDALAAVADKRADVTSVFVVDGGPVATLRELSDLVGPSAADLSLLSETPPAPYDALVIPPGGHARSLVKKILSLHQRMSPPAMLLEVCRADRFVRADVDAYARFEKIVEHIVFD